MHIGKMDDYITLGMQVLYDKAGTIGWTSTDIFPALNYHKSLSASTNKYLSLAFMGGFVQNNFDRSRLTTNSTYDNGTDGENFMNTSYNYLDGSVGLSFNSNMGENENDNYFLGVAYHHLNHPTTSFFGNPNVEIPSKWVFSAGVRFDVTEFSYLTIQADHSQQGKFNETVGGAMYGLRLGNADTKPLYTIHGGAFLRWNDAFIPTIKLDYSPFSIAFSYDVNISKLKTSSYGRGGFEVSLSYIGFKQTNSATEALRCPRF